MKDTHHLYRRAQRFRYKRLSGSDRAGSLRPQPGPHEERERQYQRPGSEVRSRVRTTSDGRGALIGSAFVITNRSGTVTTGTFPRIAETAGVAASAPKPAEGMAGIGYRGKWSRAHGLVNTKG